MLNNTSSQSVLTNPISFSSNKMLHSCFTPHNYNLLMTIYVHRLPTHFITKNNYYSGNKVFIYIKFVIAINKNFIFILTLDTLH